MKYDIHSNVNYCHFNTDLVCTADYLCGACDKQPPEDEKPNGKAEPVHIKWVDGYGGKEPECPSCGEMPYGLERCTFCGQRFLPDETTEEWSKPPVEVRMDCFLCGGKNTLVGARSRYNGHFHGCCEKCGARVIE